MKPVEIITTFLATVKFKKSLPVERIPTTGSRETFTSVTPICTMYINLI